MTGTPELALSTTPARSAAYVAGTDGDAELAFRYDVEPGDRADRLDYAGRDALSLAGGSITDGDGNDAMLMLPPPGSPESLHAAGIAIDGNATTVVVGPGWTAEQGDLAGRGDGARVTIDVSGLAGTGGAVRFPPNASVVVETSFAAVSFPPGVVAAPVPVDGLLVLHIVPVDGLPDGPRVQEALAYGASGAVLLRSIVEIGDEDGRIKFTKPVRISLEGQAGGRAFYVGGANASIVPIDMACAADDTDRVHRQLGGAGECRWESSGEDDMVIYTYHLRQFGTAESERGTPPPVYDTCSMRLDEERLAAQVRPGGYSGAAGQAVVNSGSQPFARVDLDATPWRIDPASGTPAPNATSSLPANSTLMSTTSSDAWFVPLPASGASVAHNLGGGLPAPLWFMLNLTGHAWVQGGDLVQRVTYTAECEPAR